MDDWNGLYPILKVTVGYDENTKDEYLVSAAFCHPLLTSNGFSQENCEKSNPENCFEDCEDLSSGDRNSFPKKSLSNVNICSCAQNALHSSTLKRIKIRMDALLFSLIIIELKRSRTFRRKVLMEFCTRFRQKGSIENSTCDACNKILWMVHVIAYLSTPKKNILDFKWNRRLEILVNEKCELENAMAWLSTLGGAFSALGDNYIECAEKAGAISMQQLSIALRIGDPITICRCKIYLAMSLLQRGYYGKTKKIIREMYRFSIGEGSVDFRLRNMCIAVWNRLKYVISLKAVKNS